MQVDGPWGILGGCSQGKGLGWLHGGTPPQHTHACRQRHTHTLTHANVSTRAHSNARTHGQSRPLDPLPIQLLGPDPFRLNSGLGGHKDSGQASQGSTRERGGQGKSPDAPKDAEN